MKTITFNISDEAFDLLLSIKKNHIAEYRDPKYYTKEEFLASDDVKHQSLESFLNRNSNGTLYLISELAKYNLVDSNYDAWHMTYELTDFGKMVTDKDYIRNMKLNEIV